MLQISLRHTDNGAGTAHSAFRINLLAPKKVDGVYDADPVKNPDAHKFQQLSYIEALNRGLKVMDSTALSLCMDNNIPIIVFDLNQQGNILKAVIGEKIGTYVGR